MRNALHRGPGRDLLPQVHERERTLPFFNIRWMRVITKTQEQYESVERFEHVGGRAAAHPYRR
jgi:hypothetical protein